MEIAGAAGEDGPVYEVTDVVFGDAAVAQDLVRAAVACDDAIEDAGVPRGVELEK
jgi:hypothetical protein